MDDHDLLVLRGGGDTLGCLESVYASVQAVQDGDLNERFTRNVLIITGSVLVGVSIGYGLFQIL